MSELEFMKKFGENLKEILKDEKMSQRDLADETGLSEGLISRYISGQVMPSAKAVMNIAYALVVSTDDLINFDEHVG